MDSTGKELAQKVHGVKNITQIRAAVGVGKTRGLAKGGEKEGPVENVHSRESGALERSLSRQINERKYRCGRGHWCAP